MPQLLAIAEDITKMHAICMRCGAPANYTYRMTSSKERVVVGAGEVYEARCRHCYEKPEETKDNSIDN
jgi:thymidine kinase